MGNIEKTVFISYRRTNMPWALAIYQNLTAHGYDVFFDFESIDSGDFEQIIMENIRARAHFLVVLTPSALERCTAPDDWLRREIETALDEKRNIVPLFLEGFSFGVPSISQQLTGKLAQLKNYNGLNVPIDYFNAAMERLLSRYLNTTLDTVIHPVSVTTEKEVKKQQGAANEAVRVEKIELTAQEWFERAHKHWLEANYDESIRCATQAIQINPGFAEAYNRRGTAKGERDDFDGAIRDFSEAIRIKPDYGSAYYNRGVVQKRKGALNDSIQDYTKAIHLNPDDAHAYLARGNVWYLKKDYDSAAADYQKYFDVGGTDETVRQYLKETKAKIGR